MLARITHLQFHPDKAEQGVEIVRQSIVPTIKEQRGFKGILLLRDRETGGATVVTLWESEADMEATVTGNYPVQIAKVREFLIGPPTRSTYEVEEVSV